MVSRPVHCGPERHNLVRKRTKERIGSSALLWLPSRFPFPCDDTVRPWQRGFDFGASEALFLPDSQARPTTFMVADGDEPWNEAESR